MEDTMGSAKLAVPPLRINIRSLPRISIGKNGLQEIKDTSFSMLKRRVDDNIMALGMQTPTGEDRIDGLVALPCTPQLAKKALHLPNSRPHSRSASMDEFTRSTDPETGEHGMVLNQSKVLSPRSFKGEKVPKSKGNVVLVEGQKPLEQLGPFVLLRYLGTGAFSSVWLATNLNEAEESEKRFVALKLTPKSYEKRAFHEISVLQQVQGHPSIIQLSGYSHNEEFIGMAMEWMRGGDLYNECLEGHINAKRAREIFVQILQGVAWVHAKGWVHGDIKLENVLLGDRAKICDFGLAARLTSSIVPAGSDEYLPPELATASASPSTKSDVWSLGVVLYAMLHGRMPFIRRPGQTRRSFLYRVATAEVIIDNGIGREAVDVLRAMLRRKSAERLECAQLLEMPWCTSRENA